MPVAHTERFLVEEGPVFSADKHDAPPSASSEHIVGRKASARVVLSYDDDTRREYLNLEIGWYFEGDFKKLRYMPVRWADEFVEAIEKACDACDDDATIRERLSARIRKKRQ